jgi:hypothetical protein
VEGGFVAADSFGPCCPTVEGIVKADGLGLANVEGVSTQKVSPEIRKNFDYNTHRGMSGR